MSDKKQVGETPSSEVANRFRSCRDLSDIVPLYPSHALYLKPLAKVNVSVNLPQLKTPGKTSSSSSVTSGLLSRGWTSTLFSSLRSLFFSPLSASLLSQLKYYIMWQLIPNCILQHPNWTIFLSQSEFEITIREERLAPVI